MPPYSYKNDTASDWQVTYDAYTPAEAVGHPHPVCAFELRQDARWYSNTARLPGSV